MQLPFSDKLTGRISRALEKKYNLNAMKTGEILPRLYAVKTDTVNFFVYQAGEEYICIDTGYRPLLIREELKQLHIDPGAVSHIFLTHADIDHVGGVHVFKNAKIFISSDEAWTLKGMRTLRSSVRSPRIRRECSLLNGFDIVTVGDAQVQAIATPGHTPGSMAYLVDSTYLFLGDTCKLKDGQAYAGKYFTMDYETQKESIRKLAKLQNVSYVLTAHSGYTDDFDKAFNYWK